MDLGSWRLGPSVSMSRDRLETGLQVGKSGQRPLGYCQALEGESAYKHGQWLAGVNPLNLWSLEGRETSVTPGMFPNMSVPGPLNLEKPSGATSCW